MCYHSRITPLKIQQLNDWNDWGQTSVLSYEWRLSSIFSYFHLDFSELDFIFYPEITEVSEA